MTAGLVGGYRRKKGLPIWAGPELWEESSRRQSQMKKAQFGGISRNVAGGR